MNPQVFDQSFHVLDFIFQTESENNGQFAVLPSISEDDENQPEEGASNTSSPVITRSPNTWSFSFKSKKFEIATSKVF